MTTIPASLQWLKPPGYRYEPGPQTPAQRSAQDAYERARPTPATQPQNVNPQQAGQVLGAQGRALIGAALDVGDRGTDIALRGRQGATTIDGDGFERKEDIVTDNYGRRAGVFTDNTLRLQDSQFGKAMSVADAMRGMSSEMGGRVAGAIAGEQGNDRMKLEILREALKPSLVDNISGIAGAIAPLLAVFAA